MGRKPAKETGNKYAARRQAIIDSRLDFTKGVSLPEDLPDYVPPSEDEESAIDLTAERVKYIAQLIARGLWKGSQSATILAPKWNISASRIVRLAAEADRFVRIYSAADQQEALTDINAKAHQALDMALESGQLMAAAALIRAIGDLSIDKRPQKMNVTHEVRQLTDEELERRREDLAKRLMASMPPEQRVNLLNAAEAEVIEDVPADRPTSPVIESTDDKDDSGNYNKP